MKCPVCAGVDLLMADRQGVEIDYCPQCRGIWLDRGELDKLIERAAIVAPQQQIAAEPRRDVYERRDHDKHGHDDHHGDYHGHKKRKSWLSEIMDIG
ncbi:MAG: zf-TFIIB domain-containing protein [bacterium]